MSHAKAMKMREYGTDILSHSSQPIEATPSKSIRNNNTFKSSVMPVKNPHTQYEPHDTIKDAKSKDRLNMNTPFAAKVQRASYQDSNIFGYKDTKDPTVQSSANR